MGDRISKTQRWLDLIAFLVGRKVPVEVERIMEGVPAYAERYVEGDATTRESVRRMFERDKDELRDLGVPIETVPLSLHFGAEEVLAYRLRDRDFYLPYLRIVAPDRPEPPPSHPQKAEFRLAEDEVGLVLDALHTVSWIPSSPLKREADSALRKLTFDLEAPRVGAGASGFLYLERPGATEIRARVRALSDALRARKRVRFTYHGVSRGEDTERDVAPYGLLFQGGHWYLIGHDRLRDDVRVFRAGRMEEPIVNRAAPKSPDYEIPAAFSLDDYRSRDAWELGSDEDRTLSARVAFEFPTSLWAARNDYGSLEEELPDGSQVRTFRVRQVQPFLRWILSLEGRARIAGPPELVRGLQELARDVLDAYETSAAGAATDHPDAPEAPGGSS